MGSVLRVEGGACELLEGKPSGLEVGVSVMLIEIILEYYIGKKKIKLIRL